MSEQATPIRGGVSVDVIGQDTATKAAVAAIAASAEFHIEPLPFDMWRLTISGDKFDAIAQYAPDAPTLAMWQHFVAQQDEQNGLNEQAV